MSARCPKLFRNIKNGDGFTLIEMLIVIIILGILAMVIIPQITVSTEDAKISTLKTNLSGIRGTIEVYYAQHNMTYPGRNSVLGVATADADAAALAFVNQLTQFTDATGKVAVAYNATTAPFGPYIKGGGLPTNPFNNLATVKCDVAETDITKVAGLQRIADAATGWKYMQLLGVIFANDETSGAADDKPHKKY